MTGVLVVHIFAAGLWLGCAFAEVVLETMRQRGSEHAKSVATFHYYIDLFVELPFILTTVGTGLYLANEFGAEGWGLVKLVLGLIGAGSNILSIWVIVLRKRATDAGDDKEVAFTDKRFLVLTALTVPAAMAAMVIGLVRAF